MDHVQHLRVVCGRAAGRVCPLERFVDVVDAPEVCTKASNIRKSPSSCRQCARKPAPAWRAPESGQASGVWRVPSCNRLGQVALRQVTSETLTYCCAAFTQRPIRSSISGFFRGLGRRAQADARAIYTLSASSSRPISSSPRPGECAPLGLPGTPGFARPIRLRQHSPVLIPGGIVSRVSFACS